MREYLYAYAAVAPALGQMVSLILPDASTAMMNRFLEEVSRVFSTYFIIMQVDGAGRHRANDLVVPENIRLISQPAYSPELNPVEHIWDELREKHFHNRCFLHSNVSRRHCVRASQILLMMPSVCVR